MADQYSGKTATALDSVKFDRIFIVIQRHKECCLTAKKHGMTDLIVEDINKTILPRETRDGIGKRTHNTGNIFCPLTKYYST